MTVLFVAGRDPRDEISGGHSAYVRAYARAALLAGYRPHLFCAAADSRVEETPFGVVHRVASPVRPFRQLAAGFHAAWLVPALVRCGIDAGLESGVQRRLLLHGFGVWGCAAVTAAAELRGLGRPAAVAVSSYTTYEEEARAGAAALASGAYGLRHRAATGLRHLWVRLAVERWERQAYVGADRLLVNYDGVRRLVEAKYGAAPRLRRIPYTCESAFLPPVQPAPPSAAAALASGGGAPLPPTLVTVARHDARKGVDVLLRALAALRAGGLVFRAILVGGGPLLADHRRLASNLGLDGMAVLTGVVPDPRPYLAAADLFVLPSRSEQSGSLAILEALHAGLPVVASGVDGIAEDLTDGDDALLVPPGDPLALAAAIRRCLDDAGLRQRLAQRGHESFERRFSPAAVAAALSELYGGLAERR